MYVGQQEALAVSGENSAKAEIANSDADLAEAEALQTSVLRLQPLSPRQRFKKLVHRRRRAFEG